MKKTAIAVALTAVIAQMGVASVALAARADTTAPVVTSSLKSGSYNSEQTITLSVRDNKDKSPTLYYTTDGTVPSKASKVYAGETIVARDVKSKGVDLYIRTLAVDASGNQSRHQFSYEIHADSAKKVAKNVILMISDGASWGTWNMAANWEKGIANANALPQYKTLPVRLGMTTYPLNTSNTPTNDAVAKVSYDAAKAWDTTVGTPWNEKYQTAIEGYKYLRSNYTDSAAAGSAMASGQKTYNNAINYDNFGKPMTFITQVAKQAGKATGVVTSVQFSHATPATFAAQNISRKDMTGIAKTMLTSGNVDLIMGTGHPDFDGNGVDVTKMSSEQCAASSACQNRYDTIGQTEWQAIKAGTLVPSGASATWTLVDEKSDFESLANNNLDVKGPLFGLPKVRWTLQQGRDAAVLGADASEPSGVKMIDTVPDLSVMTKGALNYLSKKSDKGFFVMVEGGAVDWAAHANQADRMVEEQVDFNHALKTVEDWVAKNSSWDETLLIVTTDHGNALPLSPNSDTIAFDMVKNAGQGNKPEVRFWSDNHTNEVVRFWAKGAGSDNFYSVVKGQDPQFAKVVGQNSDGSYIDNTDISKVIKSSMGVK